MTLISANEAKRRSVEALNKDISTQLTEIEYSIDEAIKQHKLSTEYKGELLPEVLTLLKDYHYVVSDMGYCWSISWAHVTL